MNSENKLEKVELKGGFFRKHDPMKETITLQKKLKPIEKDHIKSIKDFDNRYPEYTPSVPVQVKNSVIIYQTELKKSGDEWDNHADFHLASKVSKLLSASHLKSGRSDKIQVVVAGLNHGFLLKELLKCLSPSSYTAYGFEIDSLNLKQANGTFGENPDVHLLQMGVSNQSAVMSVGGRGQISGLYDEAAVAEELGKSFNFPTRQNKKSRDLNLDVRTISLEEFTKSKGLSRVDYLTIDVEGHETNVIQGMQLTSRVNQKKFPFFQMELGGTWIVSDPRHPKGSWTQYETISFLEKLGYSFYLIGMRVLLPVESQFFRFGPMKGHKHIIQGNLLIIHKEFGDPFIVDYLLKNFGSLATVSEILSSVKYPKNKALPLCDEIKI
jgi:FkbM family methyltransferase